MNKPNNYDKTTTTIEKPNLGGHTATILNVLETVVKKEGSLKGKPMIAVSIDFDQTDGQAGFFTKKYKANDNPDKKWPNQATAYIVVENANGDTNRSFKSFCEDVEASNGITIEWGDKDFSSQLKNKKIGVVYKEVENEWDGQRRMVNKIAYFCRYDEAKDAAVPAPKYLPKPEIPEGFVPTDISEDLPF